MTTKELKRIASKLTSYQKDQIRSQVLRFLALNDTLEDTTPKCCPHCKDATAIIKKGKPGGKQQYQCKTCGRKFRYDIHQLTAHSHQPVESWITVMEDTLALVPLRTTAGRIQVCYTTAFYMRHKLLVYLEHLMNTAAPLEALVELDETYVLESQKGAPVTHRKPRKHGERASQRGLSNGRYCVCVATDREGHVHAKCTNRAFPTADNLIEALGDHIAPKSVILTDGVRCYGGLAKHVQCKRVILIGHESYNKVYHLNTVNSLHSRFRHMIRQYRGVSSKYLNRYAALLSAIAGLRTASLEAAADDLRRALGSVRLKVTIESEKSLGLLAI